MKTQDDHYSVNVPPALAAEIEAIAHEEHRPADELVHDAVKRYLEERREQHSQSAPRKNLAQFLLESPFAGSDLDLERRQDYGRPVDL